MTRNNTIKLGLGGGCHWCTEAVIGALKGVKSVEQGWIASTPPNDQFSEAVLAEIVEGEISLEEVIEVHLNTHSATANHSMRKKYRSAVYVMNSDDSERVTIVLAGLQKKFAQPLVTRVLPFHEFKINQESYRDYYNKNPDKAFCQTYIKPKLEKIQKNFNASIDLEKLK